MIKMITFKFQHLKHKTKRERERDVGLSAYRTYSANRDLDQRKSPGEIKRREVELGLHSWIDCLAAELFLNS